MSRLPAIDPDQAPACLQPILSDIHASLGAIPNLFRVATNSPASLDALAGAAGALSKGAIKAAAREAIALTVAEANGCDYCLSAHAVLGTGAGLSEVDIEDARHGRAADAKLNAILTFSRTLVINRGNVTNSDFAQLGRAGVTNGEIVEIVANVALNIFTNYLNKVADTEIDFPVVRAGMPIAA